MKIVIDIPEEMYKKYQFVYLPRGCRKTITYNLLKAIKEGTPLPNCGKEVNGGEEDAK